MSDNEKKLKTLKDFVNACSTPSCPYGYCPPHIAEWLRSAAMEWIKDIGKNKQLNSDKYDRIFKTYWMTEKELDAMIMWIKHFFNLEE